MRTFKADKTPNPQFVTLPSHEALSDLNGWPSYGQSKNWILDVGSGDGRFALDLAESLQQGSELSWVRDLDLDPSSFVIAIERTRNKFLKLKRNLEQKNISNFVACHTDAVSFVTHFVPKKSLKTCFLMYPNPELKNPSQRWIRRPFFGHLLEKMTEGSRIVFATNIEFYSQEILQYSHKVWSLRTEMQIITDQVRTSFEKKYKELGHTVFQITLHID